MMAPKTSRFAIVAERLSTHSGLFSFPFPALQNRGDPRLPWQRNPAGFIAYPEGAQFKDRVATISHDMTSSVPWQWWISYDAAKKSDHAKTMQGAADAATEAWPEMKVEAARLAAVTADAEALRTMVQRMMAKGDLPLSIFAIETADNKRLTRIIDIVKAAGGLNGPAKQPVDECSAELFRRRTSS